MKSVKNILKCVAAVAMLLPLVALSSCSKEHQCKCVPTDVPDDGLLQILVVDRGMSCDDITMLAFERHIVTDDGHFSLERTDVHPVMCRDYGD